jgi:hypothetical protein
MNLNLFDSVYSKVATTGHVAHFIIIIELLPPIYSTWLIQKLFPSPLGICRVLLS